MSRFALVAVMAMALLGVAAANSVEKTTPDALGISAEHLRTVWVQNDDQTVFTYRVNVAAGAEDLSHWLLQASGDCLSLVDEEDEWTAGTDSVSDTTGFIHDFGVAASDEAVSRVYTIRFAGKVATGEIMYSAVGGSRWTMDAIAGPICGGDTSYPDLGEGGIPADQHKSCDEEIDEAEGDVIVDQSCPHTYTIKRTLTLGSAPLETDLYAFIHVSDSEAPQFVHTNRTHVVECGVDAEPAEPDVEGTVTDNCGEVHVSDCEEITQRDCEPNWTRVKTWTAVDECGNSNCFTITVVHQDTLPPVITDVPEDLTLSCTDAIPPANNETVTVTDVCSDCIGQVHFKEVEIDGECGNTKEIQRTWTVADCCGNQATATQVISIVDNTPPVLEIEDGARSTFECDETVVVPTVTATDDCQDEDPVVPAPESVETGDSCSKVITYTWTVSDDCWNVATTRHTITVQDRTDPRFDMATLPNATLTVTCDTIPEPASPQCYDNCNTVTVELEETPFSPECPNEQVINRTWTCTDACGLSTSFTQIITVIDEVAPIFADGTVPPDASYECESDWTPAKPAEDIEFVPEQAGCDGNYTVTLEETNSTDDKCDFVTTRVYTAVDCSGNTATARQVISVKDDVSPVLYPRPADTTVECDAVPEPDAVGMSDNCDCSWDGSGASPDCNAVEFEETIVDGSVECENGNYDLNRTWSTVDSCGNTDVHTQIVRVVDNNNPSFDEEPLDIWTECDDVKPRPTLTASDNCTAVTVTEHPEETLQGDCANNYTLVWVWTATDACGNSVNFTQLQHVEDKTAPTLSGVPEDATVECDSVPCPADVEADDNCDGLELVYEQAFEEIPGECNQTYYLVRSWTATDACGHSTTEVQRILVQDTTAPVWASQIDDYTVECDDVTFPELPEVSDNCGEVEVTEHHTDEAGSCPQALVLYRAYKATDECGNVAWLNYTVNVVDTTAPVLSGVPADVSNECTLPEPAEISASDNCDPAPGILTPSDSETSRDCLYNYTVVRTFGAIDACGNQATAQQTLTVYDETKPVLQEYPVDASYECSAPAAESIGATDNCGFTATVVPTVVEVSRECAHKYVEERTWTVSDECGNTESHTQTVTVYDDAAPTLEGVPSDVTVSCDDVPCPATVSASDNCPGVTIDFVEERINGSCPQNYVLVRTWTATDACGQSTSATQRVTVQDTEAPELPAAEDIVRSCDAPVSIFRPNGEDNCGAITITDYTTTTEGNCSSNYVVNHANEYADECGNVAWYNFTETVYDNAAPFPTSWVPAPPADASYDTADRCDFPEPPRPILDDNCDDAPTYSIANFTEDDKDCEYARTRTHTYTFVDECQNEDTLTITYTISHTQAPTFTDRTPNDTTVECPYVDPQPQRKCVDACGNEFDAVLSTETVEGDCEGEYSLVRTWTCTDLCGLQTTATQTVTVVDTTAPTFVQTPGDKYVDWLANGCKEIDFATVTATDNCSDATVVPSRETLTTECPYRYTERHTFVATDACGNQNTHSYDVEYDYTCTPYIYGVPSDETIECSEQPTEANPTAEDCCGESLTVTAHDPIIHEEGPQDCANSFIIERCWSATDSCGQTTTMCQNTTVVDTTAPVIDSSNIPGDATVECGFVPGYPNVTVTDNCAGVKLWLNVSEEIHEDCCWRHINRTWSAVDECGNEAVPVVQRIHVEDNIPPVLIGVPPDVVAECPYEVQDANVTAGEPPLALGWCINDGVTKDACGAADADSLSGVTLKDGSSGSLNFAAGSTVIRWNDVVGKLFVRGTLNDARDNGDQYDLVLELSGLTRGLAGILELDGSCYESEVNVSTWRFYTALEGNLTGIAGTATEGYEKLDFSVVAGEEPQNGMGANGVNTGAGLRAALAVAGGSNALLRLGLTADGQGECDVGDWLFPRKQILHGDMADPEHPELECNETVPVTETVTEEPGCGGSVVITRCWSAKDFHNNTVEECQTITITDTTNPTLSGVPDSIEIECSDDLPCPADVYAEDSCSNVTLEYVQSEPYDVDPECPSHYKIKRTWTATDDCGNSHEESQVITLVDETRPVFSGIPEEDGVYTCLETPEPPTVTASDNCDEDVEVVTTGPERTDGSCPLNYMMTYTYTATDNCGNVATDNWKYTTSDPFKPVIDAVADLSLSCDDALPPANPTCQDSCEGTIAMADPVVEWTNTSTCSFSVTRTWTCTDACGNAADPVVQTITFSDDVAPTCAEPADSTIECTEEVPPQGDLECSDNCDEDLSVVKESWTRPSGVCPANYRQIYQWTVTDCAGHSNVYTEEIVVQDTEAPVLTGVPESNLTFACRAEVTKPEKVCANDACSTVTVAFNESWTESGVCRDQATATRVWTATDACGNSVTEGYSITVHDDVAPVCEPIADETVSCDEFVSRTRVQPSCSDNCGTVNKQLFESETAGCEEGCEYAVHYDWLVTDACGNPTWVNYTVSVIDPYTPEFAGVPADATYECEGVDPVAPTASHPCKGDLTVTNSSEFTTGSCPYDHTTVWTYTAVGCCGETITTQATVKVQDTGAPLIDEAPASVTVGCNGIPPAEKLSCQDECSGSFEADFEESDPYTGPGCQARTITRTWTCTDECGLTSSTSQTIQVVDNDAPVLSGIPADATQECDSTDFSHNAAALDECDGAVEVVNDTIIGTGECADSYPVTLTFSATDSCGNTATAQTHINVVDTTRPEFDVCSCNSTEACEYCSGSTECDAPPADPALPPATDNCDEDVEVTSHHSTEEGRCEDAYTQFYAFRAVDNCGNDNWLNFSVEVDDTTAPVFEEFPADKSDECWDLDELEVPVASDNCANSVLSGPDDEHFVLEETSTKVEGECENYTITRKWTISDRCGNSNTATQVITVKDEDAPTWDDELPADFTVECDQDPEMPVLTASDRCGSATVVPSRTAGPDDGDNCDSTRTEVWKWVATDLCGNSIEHNITVTWQDTTAPTLEGVPEDATVECTDIPCPADVEAFDNCGGLTLEYSQEEEQGDCDGDKTIRRTWTATDCAGNSVSATQTIHVVDTVAPEFAAPGLPADETLECTENVTLPSANCTDDCSRCSVSTASEEVAVDGECEANYDVVQTWTATDDCGNSRSGNRTVRVRDTVPPEIKPMEPVCLQSVFLGQGLTVGSASVPGTLFDACDSCSNFTIVLTGCHSNQDEALAVTPIDGTGFNSDCSYDAETDVLTIVPVLSPAFPEGRVFVVSATVVDDCGNEDATTTQIYVPWAVPQSQEYLDRLEGEYALPDDFVVVERCVFDPNTGCVGACPCELADELCLEGDAFDSIALTPLASNEAGLNYDAARDETTWSYRLDFTGSDAPSRVVVGLDLSRLEVVSVSPAEVPVLFGGFFDTYVSGLIFDTSAAAGPVVDLAVTVRGNLAESGFANVPVQVGGGVIGDGFLSFEPVQNDCSTVRQVKGPDYASASYRAGNDVLGKVYATGALSADGSDARLPVGGVVVDLVDLSSPTRSVLRTTMTAHDGSYAFHDVGDIASVGVALAADGFLRPNPALVTGSAGELFSANVADPVAQEWPYGLPQAVTVGSDNDVLVLRLDDVSRPRYLRVDFDGEATMRFTGDSGSSAYWCFQLAEMGQTETSSRLASLVAAASADAPCVSAATVCTSAAGPLNTLKRELFAAALNRADGRGISQPFDALNSFYVAYGRHVACEAGAPSAADLSAATQLLQRLNNAGGL